MKKNLFWLGLALFSTLFSFSGSIPEVHLRYSFVPFDRACSEVTGSEIEKAWINELEQRLPEFQETWDREGRPLLKALVEETGLSFSQKDYLVTLTLCKWRSMSRPLIVNARRYLQSWSDGEPRAMLQFVATVFHELLHNYLTDLSFESPLIQRYKDEPGSVKAHVHLCATMKMVYLKLGLNQALDAIIEKDVAIGPIYRRAWEIVNELEGHEAFMAEVYKAKM